MTFRNSSVAPIWLPQHKFTEQTPHLKRAHKVLMVLNDYKSS